MSLIALMLLAAAPATPAPDKAQAVTWPAESVAAAAAIKARKAELDARPSERRCLGADAVTCLASMGYYVYVSSAPPGTGGLGELKLPKAVERDIHGQPISQMVSFLVSFSPGARAIAGPDVIDVNLFLEDGAHVSRVTFFLPESPGAAKTEEQWRATRVFELATAAMGAECVGSDRLAFYRRYDDAQRVDGVSRDIGSDVMDPGVSSGVHGHIAMCGARMSMTTPGGVSLDAGNWAGSLLSFETVR